MMEAEQLRARLESDGWASYRASTDPRNAILEAATGLGEIVPGRGDRLIEVLSPRSKDRAPPATLSRRFGLSALPLHCDAAHWPIPCRYVVLACQTTGKVRTPTLLFDTLKLRLTPPERTMAHSAVFCVRNGRGSFYASILDAARPFLRIDPGCMEPIDLDGVRAMELFGIERLSKSALTIEWTVGRILIIDNWRVLHGRGNAASADEDRQLLRAYVR